MKIFLKIGYILLGIFTAFYINFDIIENWIIPDACVYHNNPNVKTSFLFNLFHSFPISENGHPFPSIFNFALTILIGGFLGYYFLMILQKIIK